MTALRIPEALRYKLESEMKNQPNRVGIFILAVATSNTADFAYELELELVTDRASAIESLARKYRLAGNPQRRGLVVKSLGETRTVGTYLVNVDNSRRLSKDELLVLEEFHGDSDAGEYQICSPELKAAIESISATVQPKRGLKA